MRKEQTLAYFEQLEKEKKKAEVEKVIEEEKEEVEMIDEEELTFRDADTSKEDGLLDM
jgi:hypothetical protein